MPALVLAVLLAPAAWLLLTPAPPPRSPNVPQIAANKLRASGLARWAGTEDDPPIPAWAQQQAAAAEQARTALEQEAAEEEAARAAAAAVEQAQEEQEQRRQAEARDEGLPRKGPFWRLTGSSFPEAAPLTAARQRQQQGLPPADEDEDEDEEAALANSQRPLQRAQPAAGPPSLYLGVVSVPLPPAGNRSSTQPQTQQELNQRQAEKERLQATYPAIELRRAGGRNGSSNSGNSSSANGSSNGAAGPPSGGGLAALRPANIAAAEVHLRRLDTFDTLHRRAVAAITIDAPPEVRTHGAVEAGLCWGGGCPSSIADLRTKQSHAPYCPSPSVLCPP